MTALHCGSWGRFVIPSLAARPGNPDTGLIRLCSRLLAAKREMDKVSAEYAREEPCTNGYAALGDKQQLLGRRCDHLAWQIGTMSARTAVGLKATAAAVRAVMPRGGREVGWVDPEWHEGMLPALLDGLTEAAA